MQKKRLVVEEKKQSNARFCALTRIGFYHSVFQMFFPLGYFTHLNSIRYSEHVTDE